MSIRVRLDVDSNRDGVIDSDEPGSSDWTWGPQGSGAIVPVQCGNIAIDEAAPIDIVIDGDDRPPGLTLLLSLDPFSSTYVQLRREPAGATLAGMLDGSQAPVTDVELECSSARLYLTALSFPNAAFDGLVQITVVLKAWATTGDGDFELDEAGEHVYAVVSNDTALFRVAPWIMPTTLCNPEEVYVVNLGAQNSAFISGLTRACEAAAVPLHKIPASAAAMDQWIQDEVEIGYASGPTFSNTIILDGPRDRQLDGIAQKEMARPGDGVWNVHKSLVGTSLNSFGNLEVSPPVTVNGVRYPLGRIVIGRKGVEDEDGRKSTLALRQFLYNQKVQAPIEIFSDWLYVGHVDEIISFVPDPASLIGFRILIASPRSFRSILERLRDSGHQDAILWKGLYRLSESENGGRGPYAGRTVSQLLAGDDSLGDRYDFEFNEECAQKLDHVREQLVAGLGVTSSAFYDVPVGFKKMEDGRALAYFPDMVNHVVLGDHSVVPDPYGPVTDGVDQLKQAFLDAVGARAQHVHFVDDWLSYHELAGEAHCGTNVRRTPDSTSNWWDARLPGMWDAAPAQR